MMFIKYFSYISKLLAIFLVICNSLSAHSISFKTNIYNDVEASIIALANSNELFEQELTNLISIWKNDNFKAIWLRIPKKFAVYIPIMLEHEFVYHHAISHDLVMIRDLQPGGKEFFPHYATSTIGTAALVLDENNNILAVIDKDKKDRGFKLPGGALGINENIESGAIREVKEETGIDCEFIGIVGWWHANNWPRKWLCESDICFACLLKPLTKIIKIQESEILDARWLPFNEFKKNSPDVCPYFIAAYESFVHFRNFKINKAGMIGTLYGYEKLELSSEMAAYKY